MLLLKRLRMAQENEDCIKFKAFRAARKKALRDNNFSEEFIEKFGLDKEEELEEAENGKDN